MAGNGRERDCLIAKGERREGERGEREREERGRERREEREREREPFPSGTIRTT